MRRNGKHARFSEQAIEMIAERFKLLSEPTRLKILMALKEGERNVSDLVNATGTTQANMSRQLAILTSAGLLSRRKEGVSVYYQVADPAIFDLCEHVCGSLQGRLKQQAQTAKLFAT